MRGRRGLLNLRFQLAGTTPAYAGKTEVECPSGTGGRDHPRVCGEDCSSIALRSRAAGPPPRMRGRLHRGEEFVFWVGTTPAYAGKTSVTSKSMSSTSDHPRVCGEDELRPRGSNLVARTTPAYAGKTSIAFTIKGGNGDHPRVCGEDMPFADLQRATGGPPPRMRGRLQPAPRSAHAAGTTPAYAGKTYCDDFTRAAARDHPRVCGEDTR